jgi:Na+-driven multidrug efflux pump
MVMLQAFNGAGDTATPTKVNVVCFWLFEIPVAWVFAVTLGFGPPAVFWSIATAHVLSAVIGVWLFRGGKWKEAEV